MPSLPTVLEHLEQTEFFDSREYLQNGPFDHVRLRYLVDLFRSAAEVRQNEIIAAVFCLVNHHAAFHIVEQLPEAVLTGAEAWDAADSPVKSRMRIIT